MLIDYYLKTMKIHFTSNSSVFIIIERKKKNRGRKKFFLKKSDKIEIKKLV